jgi:cell division septal protein FtsQ
MKFYLNEKQQRKRRRILKLKIFGILTVFFIFVGALIYLVGWSPLFQIKKFAVEPTDIEENKELIQEIKNSFVGSSKLISFLGLKQDNILIWKTEADNFYKNYPWIADLKIDKDYFNRKITIEVKKREKFGIWCSLTNDQQSTTNTRQLIVSDCWWFDGEKGIIFSKAPSSEGELINKVLDSSGRSLKAGEPIFSNKKLIENLLKIFEVLEKAELKVKTLKLEKIETQEVIVDSITVPKIYFSLRISPEFSLAALQSLKNLGLEKIEYIDLRVENRAYYKLR